MHAAQTGTLVAQTRRYTFAEPVSDDAFMAFAAQYQRRAHSPVANWTAALPERGAVYGSSTIFTWPEGSLRGLDCAWCSAERAVEIGYLEGDHRKMRTVELIAALSAIGIDLKEHASR